LTNINIPSSVTRLGTSSFEKCTGLTSIEIPSSVTHIGEKAFYECKNLKVVIDNSEDNLKIGNEAFQECGSVTYTKNAIEQTEQ
jgi:hypothetical protein